MDGAIANLLDIQETTLVSIALVFVRVGAIVVLMPGFGEVFIPLRIKLAAIVAYTLILWPAIQFDHQAIDLRMENIGGLIFAETVAGLTLGIGLRIMIMAIQTSASIIAQSSSLNQIFGLGAAPEPMPAIGNLMIIAAVTLAMATGLHVKVALAIAKSYDALPMGILPGARDVTQWIFQQASAAFSFAFAMSAPFLLTFFLINVSFGFINRAMPSLMIGFVGAPLLTGGALVILLVLVPEILRHWNGTLDQLLYKPFGAT